MIEVALAGDLEAALRAIPATPGVAQLRGEAGRSLLLGRAPNLRRWAAKNLGQGKPAKKTGRPALDLRGIAQVAAFTETATEFGQLLTFERLMADLVPLAKRRDLKPAAWLHLDATARFPRVSPGAREADAASLYGPFRDRKAAERGREALQKSLGLRPCDYVFEPAPDLALGLGCLFAQVRTCAAPCLVRIGEDEYRERGKTAAERLCGAEAQKDAAWRPEWVAPLATSRGVVVEKGRGGFEVYPVVAGAVVEEAKVTAADVAELETNVSGLAFAPPTPSRDDSAWLSAWLHRAKRKGRYFPCGPHEKSGDLAARLRDKLGAA